MPYTNIDVVTLLSRKLTRQHRKSITFGFKIRQNSPLLPNLYNAKQVIIDGMHTVEMYAFVIIG